MAYEKVYSRINWENEPSTKSPINEENLNKMDFALNEIDNRTVELSGYESIVIDYSNQAKTSATNALSSETKAKTSEQNAYSYEQSALESKNQAEGFKNESETHANNASDSERNAKLSEDNASASELLAKNSEENASGFATSASRFSENASGFAESAKTSAQNAKLSEDNASASASSAKTDSDLAKSYTVGTNGEVRENDDSDNAKYYYEQTKGISQSLSGALKPMGTIVFDNLPSSPNSGDMYNISNEFITDDRFKEGTGKTMPIGTNVYFTEDGYWDCLAGSPVTGIKGSNETSYRQGNVEITKENLGLGNVENKSAQEIISEIGNATDSSDGLMSKEDKVKLDGIEYIDASKIPYRDDKSVADELVELKEVVVYSNDGDYSDAVNINKDLSKYNVIEITYQESDSIKNLYTVTIPRGTHIIGNYTGAFGTNVHREVNFSSSGITITTSTADSYTVAFIVPRLIIAKNISY